MDLRGNIPTDINYILIRKKYIKLYSSFIKNKDKEYDDFIMEVSKNFESRLTIKEMRDFIEFVKYYISNDKGKEMTAILDLVLAKTTDNKKLIDELQKEVDCISDNIHQLYQNLSFVESNIRERHQDKHQKMVDSCDKLMDDILDGCELDSKRELGRIKKSLPDLDKEKYIDVLKKVYDIEETSSKELDQYIEVVTYFIDNIVSTNDVNMPLYRKYNTILQTLIGIKDIRNLKEISKNDTVNVKKYNEENDFVYDYYKQVRNIFRVYDKHVRKLMTVSDEKRDKIGEIYIKKLIKEDNE